MQQLQHAVVLLGAAGEGEWRERKRVKPSALLLSK